MWRTAISFAYIIYFFNHFQTFSAISFSLSVHFYCLRMTLKVRNKKVRNRSFSTYEMSHVTGSLRAKQHNYAARQKAGHRWCNNLLQLSHADISPAMHHGTGWFVTEHCDRRKQCLRSSRYMNLVYCIGQLSMKIAKNTS